MKALAQFRDARSVHVETLGETGRRFKRSFGSTPVQAQVQLADPFGNSNPAERSIWYQSRFYRVNLHLKGDLPFLRDLTVYSDRFPQPFLTEATRDQEVEQRMPAVIDGYHWSVHPGSREEPGAGGYFGVAGNPLQLSGEPRVFEDGNALVAELPIRNGGVLRLRFEEKEIAVTLDPKGQAPLSLAFRWDPSKAALAEVQPRKIVYRQKDLSYFVAVHDGQAEPTSVGWTVTQGKNGIRLGLAQPS
jgi:hypothetical protein